MMSPRGDRLVTTLASLGNYLATWAPLGTTIISTLEATWQGWTRLLSVACLFRNSAGDGAVFFI